MVLLLLPFLRRIPRPRLRATSPDVALLSFLPVGLYTLARQAQVYVERFFGSSLPAGTVTHLNYAQKIGQMPTTLSLLIATVSFPLLARTVAQGRAADARARLLGDLRVIVGLVLLATVFLLVFTPEVVDVIFLRGRFTPDDAAATAAILRVYVLGLAGQAMVDVLCRAYFSRARASWFPAAVMACGLVLTALLSALLAPRWGAPGIAAANAAGISATALLLLRARELRAPGTPRFPRAGSVVAALGPVAAALAVCLVVRRAVVAPDVVVLAIGGLGAVAAYVAALAISRHLRCRRPVKVLHVITGLSAGGAEQQLRLLCRHLDPDIEVEVAVLTEPGSIARAIRDEGTPVHHVPMRHNRDLGVVARLVRLMRAGRYDCVHTHLFRAGLYGRLAARLARVPRILATEHSLSDGVLEGRSTRRRGLPTLYRLTETLGDLTLAVSSTTRERMLAWRVPPGKVHVLPNGVDRDVVRFSEAARRAIRDELGIPRDATVVGSIARLVATKNVDVLLEAVAAIPGLYAIIVGDGPERAPLQRRADRLRVRDRVVFTGERPDIGGLLSAVDVVVSACDHETYGLALIEALAAGLPVFYRCCPAIEEQPAALAPDARRVHNVDELVAAVRELTATPPPDPCPPDRRPCALVDIYDIRRVADELGRLYRSPGGRRPRTPSPARSERNHSDVA